MGNKGALGGRESILVATSDKRVGQGFIVNATVNVWQFNTAAILVPIAVSGIGLALMPLYTCPSGRKAFFKTLTAWNPTAGTILPSVYISRESPTASSRAGGVAVGAGAFAPVSSSTAGLGMVGGETLWAKSDTAASLGLTAMIIEVDESEPIRTVKTNPTLAAGDQPLYTCPPDKTASVLANAGTANESGGAASLTAKFKQRDAATWPIALAGPVVTNNNNSGVVGMANYPPLRPGDQVLQAVTADGLVVWVNVLEFSLV